MSVNGEHQPWRPRLRLGETAISMSELEQLRRDAERAEVLLDAIRYALEVDDGLNWLRAWFEADPETMTDLEKWRAEKKGAVRS